MGMFDGITPPYGPFVSSMQNAQAQQSYNAMAQQQAMMNTNPFAGRFNPAPTLPKESTMVTPKKHGIIRTIVIVIAAAWLAHKVWHNRDRIAAKLERIGNKLAAKLGLND